MVMFEAVAYRDGPVHFVNSSAPAQAGRQADSRS